jgi:hypothetical protein
MTPLFAPLELAVRIEAAETSPANKMIGIGFKGKPDADALSGL